MATEPAGRGPTLIVTAVIFAALGVTSLFTPDYIIPSPRQMATAIVELLTGQSRDLAITAARLAAGVVAALVLGSALGGLMGVARPVARYGKSLLFILSGVPALSWMLLAVLWFRDTETRIFFILFIVVMPFYALNVYEGIQALPRDWTEMLEVFRPTRREVFRLLIVPHIVPYIILTTKSVSGYAIRMIVFAELIGAAVGVGARLAQAQGMFRIDRVFAWTILLVILNFALQAAIDLIERRMLAWRPAVEIR
ncbi:MAG: ABC transporter permease subunit [Candidatus Rokubacteria bacterium]|nr:ABC transporter permease subunit [Candidatus Rokubacteria bacterium]